MGVSGTTGRFLKKFVPTDLRTYMRDIQNRITKLEEQARRIEAQQATIAMLEATLETAVSTTRYSRGPAIGFNGQLMRKQIFSDIIAAIPFETVVETGTWTGDTTGFMAETSRLPVFSCELNYRSHTLARRRLVDFAGITLQLSDSRRFLSELAGDPVIANSKTFFYLDAHWYADLPLLEEVALIAKSWSDFVIMVDDFQVPGDEGYGYDDYGPGKALTLEYLSEAIRERSLTAYFPSARSADESGHKRGCVILAPQRSAEALDLLTSIKRS